MFQLISWWKHQELIENYARGILLSFGKVISVRAPGTTRLIMYMKFANHHHGRWKQQESPVNGKLWQ